MFSRFTRFCLPALLATTVINAYAQSPVDVSPASRIAIGIETEILSLADSIKGVSATGLVIAPAGKTHAIPAAMSGVILETYIVPGQEIKAGQKIALVYSDEFAATQIDLKKAQLASEHDKHLAERATELGKLGLRSDAEVEEAEHEAKNSQLSVQALRNRLAQSKKAPGAGRYVILAKQSGMVIDVVSKSGQSISAYQPVAHIFSGSDYWGRVQVPDTKISQVSIGGQVTFLGTDKSGTVVAINPEVDKDTRAVEVMVAMPDSSRWRLGQIITANFQTSVTEGLISVPTRAIVRIGGESFVFVETPSGFITKPVSIHSQAGQMSLIAGPLQMGDRLAVSGTAALKNIVEGG